MCNLKTKDMLRLTSLLLAAAFVFTSCGQGEKTTKDSVSKSPEEAASQKAEKTEVALAFINAYNDNCNKLNKAMGVLGWVNSNNLATQSFKTELKRIIDEAYKQDPELGLDADPILDAQDFPAKGFELDSLDEKTNYIRVKGKDWPEFLLTMKVAEENGKWLVDGCGMVNIPVEKRAKR